MNVKYEFTNNNNLKKFNSINLGKELTLNNYYEVEELTNMLIDNKVDINKITNLLMEKFSKESPLSKNSLNKKNLLRERIHFILLKIRDNFEKNESEDKFDNVEFRMGKLYLLLLNNLVVKKNSKNNNILRNVE